MKTEVIFGVYDEIRGAFHVKEVNQGYRHKWDTMEVWYRADCRKPRVGDVLAVFIDVTAPWALAPKREDKGR